MSNPKPKNKTNMIDDLDISKLAGLGKDHIEKSKKKNRVDCENHRLLVGIKHVILPRLEEEFNQNGK